MSHVGRFNLRLTVEYAPPMMGQPPQPDTVITRYVDVLPPDNDVVVQGFNTPTPLDNTGANRVPVKFEMRRGGTPIGTMVAGHVQEYIISWDIYNYLTTLWDPVPYEPTWYPPPDQGSALFYKQGNLIIDRKSAFYNYSDAYAAFNLNFVWMKVTQVNRLIALNWLNEEVIFEFQSHDFLFRKSNGNTWILTE